MSQGRHDDESGPTAAADKYRVSVEGSEGVQIGEGNLQVNFLFGDRRPSGPVVAGSVPQAPPALQPREDLMVQLRTAGPGISVVRAVTGMRGVGKTQLAAAYARECIDAGWRLVAWIDAEDTSSVLSGLEVVANRLGIDKPGTALEEIGVEVRNRVEADGGRCLMIYDNVVDPDALRPYLPAAGNSQVVVTSTQVSALALGKPTQVTVFTEQESKDFLAERTGLRDPDGALTLARELGHLPLALAQAAAVIRAQRLTYPVYLDRLRSYAVASYLRQAKGVSYPRGVAEAILFSIDTVTGTDEMGLCADLLRVISLLSPDGIPRDLLYLGESEDIFAAAVVMIDEALARLGDASLLTFGGEDESNPVVAVHRLVMRVTRERDARDGIMNSLGTKTCALLAAASDSLGEPWQHREKARDLIQQVLSLTDHLGSQTLADLTPLSEALLARRGWALLCLLKLGDSAVRAIELGEPLVADSVRVLGEDHPDTLSRRNDLAVAYWAAGRLDEAIPLYERTLADRVRALGDGHPDALESRNNLATAYWAAGRADEAIPLFERTLDDQIRVLGSDNPDTLSARNNLAFAYRTAGRLSEALPLLEQTLADRVRVLGDDHPAAMASRNNLALAYRDADRLDEAVPLFEQALGGFERLLGEEHPDTLQVRKNLKVAREELARQEKQLDNLGNRDRR